MTKRLKVTFVILTALVMSVSTVHAKGPSDKAMEHASDQSIFNRVDDFVSTIGKDGAEKEAILAEKRAKRAAKRAEKEARKAEAKANKEMKGKKADAEKKKKEMKKKAEKKQKEMKAKMAKMGK